MKHNKIFIRSFFVLLEAGLMGFASCTNEDESVKNGVPVGGGKAVWTFEVGADGSRTQLDGDNKVVFKKGDAISVFNNADTKNDKFVADKDEDFPSGYDATAKTATFNGTANIGAQHFTILYPYQGGDSAKAVSVGSGVAEITATIPTVQTATEGNFDPKANVSVAVTDAHPWDVPKFYLKNVVGLLKFTAGTSADVTNYDKIEIKGANNENIAGKVSITVSGTGAPAYTVTAGEKKITLTGVKPGKIYYVGILPKSFAQGITMTFFNGASNVGTKTIFNGTTGPTINRSRGCNVGTVTPEKRNHRNQSASSA